MYYKIFSLAIAVSFISFPVQAERKSKGLFSGLRKTEKSTRQKSSSTKSVASTTQVARDSYEVDVKLSRQDGVKGELKVYKNGSNHSILTCETIGGTKNQRRSIRTPSGTKTVYEADSRFLYQGQILRGRNATYFARFAGNPIAIHSGDTGQNSHGCVRVSSSCASRIMGFANRSASAAKGQSRVFRDKAKRNFNMKVHVSYF